MDFSGAQINFPCPECGFLNEATLGDVISGSSLICVGCLNTIQLVDEDSDTKRAVDEVSDSINELGGKLRRGH